MKKLIIGTLILTLLMISNLGVAFSEEDPDDDTPTDDSIEIKIDSVEYKIKAESLTEFKLTFKVTGTTSTTNNTTAVHHIGTSLWTFYYKNGTVGNGDIMEYGPEGFEYSDEDVTMKITKKEENWTKWEIEYETKLKITIDEQGNISGEMSKLDESKVFVRAYSDEDGNNWTQVSRDITELYKNAWLGLIPGHNKDSSNDSPGFALQGLVAAVGAALLVSRKYRAR